MNCPNCGSPIPNGNNNCGNCGYRVNQTNNQINGQTTNQNFQSAQAFSMPKTQERNIAVCVILSMVTCGIYGLYWFAKMTDESNSLAKTKNASGIVAILLSLVTCGIYMFYWNYQMGKKLYEAGQTYGKDIKDNSVLYLILSFTGFGAIVNEILIQMDLNKFAD